MKPISFVRIAALAFLSLGASAGAIEPERQPIYSNTIGGLMCGVSAGSQCTVPAGQRLIIEHVSGYVFRPTSSNTATAVSMVINDAGLGLKGNSFHSFVATKTSTSGQTDVFVFHTPLKMMLHPQARFWFSATAVSVSGYLVDQP